MGEHHMAAVDGIGSEEMQSRKAPWQGVASFRMRENVPVPKAGQELSICMLHPLTEPRAGPAFPHPINVEVD